MGEFLPDKWKIYQNKATILVALLFLRGIMDGNLKLYTVNSQYINYLKQFQEHIWANEDKGRLRPYIGIVIILDPFKYYAPLSSPKIKHENMKDRLDFIRIDHKGDLKSVINLNNIIPVDDKNITLFDVPNESEPYRSLLNTEIIEIRKKQHIIINNAKIIYNKVTKHKDDNVKLCNICYDFKLLEQKLIEYNSLSEVAATKEN